MLYNIKIRKLITNFYKELFHIVYIIYSWICFIDSIKITYKHKKLSRHDFLNIATMEKLDKGKKY